MLGRAYAELFCLDNNCLSLAYLNGTAPSIYPDQAKLDRAAILLATPQMVESEIDRISSFAAHQVGVLNGVIWKKLPEKSPEKLYKNCYHLNS
jgi:hypothetical protein